MTGSLVLDTHAWVWWIGGAATPKLSRRARQAIETATTLLISAASCVEVAWLEAQGRVGFDRDSLTWLQQTLAEPRVTLVPISPSIAVCAANLRWNHRDPNDRLIVATALEHRAPLLTKDRAVQESGLVDTVW